MRLTTYTVLLAESCVKNFEKPEILVRQHSSIAVKEATIRHLCNGRHMIKRAREISNDKSEAIFDWIASLQRSANRFVWQFAFDTFIKRHLVVLKPQLFHERLHLLVQAADQLAIFGFADQIR